jgi:hypothetical protein
MRLTPALLVWLTVAVVPSARAACEDPAAVNAARAAVERDCPCGAFARHGAYVACARGVIDARVAAGTLPAACAGMVRRCASRSTCGRGGAVTCCRTNAAGKTRCSIRRDASRCTAAGGGAACVGPFPSCCDACAAGGCVGTCGGGPFQCGGACPPGGVCEPIGDFPPYCGCNPDGSQPCGSGQFPSCNGTCPAGFDCGILAPVPGGECACVPIGQQACGESAFPTCGGVCPDPGQQCAGFDAGGYRFCACADPARACECSVPGVCPAGQICRFASAPCGCTTP